MTEPKGFPVPPDDLRFLARAARGRSPPPPREARAPPHPSPASVAAGELLWLYIHRSRAAGERPVAKPREWPEVWVAGVSLVIACVLLPLGLIYLLTSRPELRGRELRARLVTPRDVRQAVFLGTVPFADLLNRIRA